MSHTCESSPQSTTPWGSSSQSWFEQTVGVAPGHREQTEGDLSCSAMAGNLLSHLFKHMDPRLWQDTLCVGFSQLSAVLTNFQSIILKSGCANDFVLGRKTPPSRSFTLVTRICLFCFNCDGNQVMTYLRKGTVSGISVPYIMPPFVPLKWLEQRHYMIMTHLGSRGALPDGKLE